MNVNKNFSGEVPATLQDVIYEGAFGGAHIRMQMIDGEPWFVAKDVAFALDITWSGHTLDAIPEDWQGMVNLTTPCGNYQGGGLQTLKVINEAALYKLAFRSNKPEADRFVNWVAGTLLPTLRKTGRYEIGTTKRKRLLPRDRKDIAPRLLRRSEEVHPSEGRARGGAKLRLHLEARAEGAGRHHSQLPHHGDTGGHRRR